MEDPTKCSLGDAVVMYAVTSTGLPKAQLHLHTNGSKHPEMLGGLLLSDGVE